MALVIPTDAKKPLRQVEPENGTDFKLAELYKLLDCEFIDIRRIAPEILMVLDDEGKRRRKPRNERATILADFAPPMQVVAQMLAMREAGVEVIWLGPPITDMTTELDYIVGDVLICGADEIQ